MIGLDFALKNSENEVDRVSRMLKKFIGLAIVSVMFVVVAGCSKQVDVGKRLEFVVYPYGVEDGVGQFNISLKNISEDTVKLRSMNGSMFGVVVIDDIGNVSLDKEFDGIGSMTSGVVDVVLEPGEVLSRDVKVDVRDLSLGSYTFEFRMVSEVPDVALFAYVDNVEIGIEKEKFVFKGIVDGNSVEVSDLDGEHRVFAVDEVFMDSFDDIQLDTEIEFEYIEVDGRDTISSEIMFGR